MGEMGAQGPPGPPGPEVFIFNSSCYLLSSFLRMEEQDMNAESFIEKRAVI